MPNIFCNEPQPLGLYSVSADAGTLIAHRLAAMPAANRPSLHGRGVCRPCPPNTFCQATDLSSGRQDRYVGRIPIWYRKRSFSDMP